MHKVSQKQSPDVALSSLFVFRVGLVVAASEMKPKTGRDTVNTDNYGEKFETYCHEAS